MKVISGTASTVLGKRVAKIMGVNHIVPKVEKFPDGELYVRIDDEISGDVVLIQSTYPNEKILELFLLQDALKERGAKRIITVVPYFGYSRQDKIFKEGEAISARAMAKHIELYSDAFIGVDLHADSIRKWFKIPALHLHATEPIAKYLKEKGAEVIISPDKGGYERAKLVAEKIDVEFDYLEKTRLSGDMVVIKPKNMDVSGKKVAIVDDIISTGGTIAKAAEELRDQGASKIYAVCTHGLFIGQAIENMKKVDDFAATDTIESEYSKISVAEVIAEGIKEIMDRYL